MAPVANSTKPDIIAVTETWLTESVPDAVLSFQVITLWFEPIAQVVNRSGVVVFVF